MDDHLIVLNKDEDTLSIIEVEDGKTLEQVDTAFNPHEVAVTPDGKTAFVTCSLGGKLLVFDTTTWERLATIEHEHFEFPHGLAIREPAGELWLAATRSSRIFVIDIDSFEILDVFPTYQDKSHMVALDESEETAYVANIGSDTVTVIDCDTRQIVGDPGVGGEPEGIAVHPDAGVLVANQDDNYLSVLDVTSLNEASWALLGDTPIRVVLSPDKSRALVPNRASNDVSVIDCAFERGDEVRPWEIARIPVGIWPGGTAISPDGTRAYVANNKTNDISVLDLEVFEELTRYRAGIHPDGIAYLPRD